MPAQVRVAECDLFLGLNIACCEDPNAVAASNLPALGDRVRLTGVVDEAGRASSL